MCYFYGLAWFGHLPNAESMRKLGGAMLFIDNLVIGIGGMSWCRRCGNAPTASPGEAWRRDDGGW